MFSEVFKREQRRIHLQSAALNLESAHGKHPLSLLLPLQLENHLWRELHKAPFVSQLVLNSVPAFDKSLSPKSHIFVPFLPLPFLRSQRSNPLSTFNLIKREQVLALEMDFRVPCARPGSDFLRGRLRTGH
ncbi:unnamed protein product [Rangifer tarandus platyrhynchus]|uniref:Uncharacterized protein n=2 Tax=Rangifer tarandus platyrhynchus TaxID=3082113 RepID=A0ABN8YE93_RANTA|nr:unnamed protein product [Rangifer tarandus platyrhynchus]